MRVFETVMNSIIFVCALIYNCCIVEFQYGNNSIMHSIMHSVFNMLFDKYIIW